MPGSRRFSGPSKTPHPARPRPRRGSNPIPAGFDAETENIYCLVPGSDPRLREDLVMVEAFYDSTALVAGRSPGADEALSVAALLELARVLKDRPPSRSVVLVATGGHAQSLAGMRELFWSLRERSRDLRRMETGLKRTGAQRPQDYPAAEGCRLGRTAPGSGR